MNADKLDTAIKAAVNQLHRSERGRCVAEQLHDLFTGPATGLDSSNHHAVALLVLSFCKEGRQGFVDDLLNK